MTTATRLAEANGRVGDAMSKDGGRLEENDLALMHLAEQLRYTIGQMNVSRKKTCEQMIDAGRMLVEAKGRSLHGQFTPWLIENGFVSRSANRWMTLFKTGLTAQEVMARGGAREVVTYSFWDRDYLEEPDSGSCPK